jgi:hypothetical protein
VPWGDMRGEKESLFGLFRGDGLIGIESPGKGSWETLSRYAFIKPETLFFFAAPNAVPDLFPSSVILVSISDGGALLRPVGCGADLGEVIGGSGTTSSPPNAEARSERQHIMKV